MKLFGPPDIDKLEATGSTRRLIRLLDSTRWPGLRWPAAKALARIGGDDALAALTKMAMHGADRTRRHAIAALGEMGDPRATVALVEALRDPHRSVRYEAAIALGLIGDKRAIKGLIQSLGDEDSHTRDQARQSLKKIGGDETRNASIAALANPSATLRAEAAWLLGAVGRDNAIEALVNASKAPEMAVRRAAVSALCGVGGRVPLEFWHTCLQDPDAMIRQAAVVGLGRSDDKRALEALVEAFGEKDDHSRRLARDQLASHDPEQVIPLLISALGDPRPGMAMEASKTLLKVKDANVPRSLIRALSHSDARVRAGVAATLGEAVLSFTRQGDPSTGRFLVLGLPWPLRIPEALAKLRPLLNDPDAHVRCKAAEAIGRLEATQQPITADDHREDTGSLAPLVEALNDGDSDVRAAAAQALGNLKSKEAVEPLVAALEDTTLPVRAQAAEALGVIGDTSAVPALIGHFSSEAEPSEMSSIIHALGRLRDQRAVQLLARILDDSQFLQDNPDRESVRLDLAVALARLGDHRGLPRLIGALETVKDRHDLQQCIVLLGELGDPTALPAVMNAEGRWLRLLPRDAMFSATRWSYDGWENDADLQNEFSAIQYAIQQLGGTTFGPMGR